jgi:hypothetical protein
MLIKQFFRNCAVTTKLDRLTGPGAELMLVATEEFEVISRTSECNTSEREHDRGMSIIMSCLVLRPDFLRVTADRSPNFDSRCA